MDHLTLFAQLLNTLAGKLTEEQRKWLAQRSQLEPAELTSILRDAQAIAINSATDTPDQAGSALLRDVKDTDMFELAPRRGAWIGVKDPTRPGRGIDIRIRDNDQTGPTIEIWPMNHIDLPGADAGAVPLEPIFEQTFLFDEHTSRLIDEEQRATQNPEPTT